MKRGQYVEMHSALYVLESPLYSGYSDRVWSSQLRHLIQPRAVAALSLLQILADPRDEHTDQMDPRRLANRLRAAQE